LRESTIRGVPLDTLQLLTAWTWSEDFDLQNRFEELRETLEEHGFAGVGEDTNLVLRCCAAILLSDPTVNSLIGINGAIVRDRFSEVENGIKGAIDCKQLAIKQLRNMPYPNMLIPLSVYFVSIDQQQIVTPGSHKQRLDKWFWRSCFSARYSGQTNRVARADFGEMTKLREGNKSFLGDIAVKIGSEYFLESTFCISTAKTATFILMLASAHPRSFISGGEVGLGPVLQAYNRHEFHHTYPQAVLKSAGFSAERIGCLANLSIISRTDNNAIRSKWPSAYKELMPQDDDALHEILRSAITPSEVFDDDFETFPCCPSGPPRSGCNQPD